MEPTTRHNLELFVEQAEALRKRSFVAHICDGGKVSVRLNFTEDGVQVEHSGPDAEAVEAVFYRLRLFLQNNDGISIANIAALSSDPGLSQGWKDQFELGRSQLNALLASPIEMIVNGERYTNGQILRTFIYGDGGHFNPDKLQMVRRWKSMPEPVMGYLQYALKRVLADFVDGVLQLAHVTELDLRGEPIPTIDDPVAQPLAPS